MLQQRYLSSFVPSDKGQVWCQLHISYKFTSPVGLNAETQRDIRSLRRRDEEYRSRAKKEGKKFSFLLFFFFLSSVWVRRRGLMQDSKSSTWRSHDLACGTRNGISVNFQLRETERELRILLFSEIEEMSFTKPWIPLIVSWYRLFFLWIHLGTKNGLNWTFFFQNCRATKNCTFWSEKESLFTASSCSVTNWKRN